MGIRSWVAGGFLALAFSGLPAFSDDAAARADAERVVALAYSNEIFSAQIDAVSSLISDAMIAEASRGGLSVSDAAASTLTSMMVPVMLDALGEGMRDELVPIYMDALSPETLASYRAFLESPAGQELLAATPSITTVSSVVGEQVGADIAASTLEIVVDDMANNRWPANTTPAAKRELKAMFGVE